MKSNVPCMLKYDILTQKVVFTGRFLCLILFLVTNKLPAQFWYLNIISGDLEHFQTGGERFADQGLLAVAKGTNNDLLEQLPHALDAYGIKYDYKNDDIIVFTASVYKTWRLMKAGKDIQATLGMLMLADLFSSIRATQTRIVGSLFQNRFPKLGSSSTSQIWQLPAVRRGVEIEIIRAGNYRLPHGFPVIDMLRNNIATSVKSLDVTLKSYQGRRLYYRLKSYTDKLINFRGASWGGRTIRGNVKKELEVVVPKGKATPIQQKIFEEVVEYGKMNNISVKFIEL